MRLVRDGQIEMVRRLAESGDRQGRRQLVAWLARTDRISELRWRVAAGDRHARRELADWLVRQGRYDEAIDEIRPLAESGDKGACRRLARLLAGRGRVEEAMSVVERLPVWEVNSLRVSGWLGSQGRFDLLRRLAAAGDTAARSELAWAVRNLWRAARLAPALDLLTSVDLGDEYLAQSLVRIANDDWRYGRLGVREVAIDLLGTVDHPLCRRVRAGLLLSQGRRDEAITELRSLAVEGDQVAGRDLMGVLGRAQPARELRSLTHARGGRIRAVAFSPDGSMLATCGSDYAILVWHPFTGEHLRTLRSRGAVSAVAFSPDGTLLASNGGIGGGAQLWDPTTGEHLRVLGGQGVVEDVVFRADGTLVAGGALWMPATGERVLDLDFGESQAVVISPDNQLLAAASRYSSSGAWNPAVRVWNLTTGEHVRDLVTTAAPISFHSLAFSPDGQLLAIACHDWVQLSDPATGEHVRRLGGADAVAFHPNGNLLATARSHHWTDAGVRLWNPATGVRVRDLNTAANALAFSPDGAYLATGSDADGVVRLWDLSGTARP
jgi:hypothetical protein